MGKVKQTELYKLKECPNKKGYTLLNYNTGEIAEVNCNTYDCPYCGPRKMAKLKKAIYDRIQHYEYVRLFTFNFRSTFFINQKHCLKRAPEIWRRFLNNIRRDKTLNIKSRNFQYIKIVEFHKSGYPHYHLIVDNYIHQSVLYKHWKHAINIVMGWNGVHGGANCKGSMNAKLGAWYVAKYVTKTAKAYQQFNLAPLYNFERRRFRLYSKSAFFKLFYPKSSIHRWIFGKFEIVKEGMHQLAGAFTCSSSSQLPQISDYFELSLPPPVTFRNHDSPEMIKNYEIWTDYREKIINHYWYKQIEVS